MSQNFTTYRGDDFIFDLLFQDVNEDPVNITGWTTFFTMKLSKDLVDSQAILKKTVTAHVDPTNGRTQIRLTSADTATLVGVFFYDIQYKDASGLIKTVTNGQITFVEDVTRRTS
jgi:hypothetical protein